MTFLSEIYVRDFYCPPLTHLFKAPGLSNTHGLAFALQSGSIYTENISVGMLHLEKQGFFAEKQKEWLKKQGVSCEKHGANCK